MIVFDKRVPLALLFAAWAVAAPAQTLYRCGNTYSQTPCAPDAVAKRTHADTPAEKGGGTQGYELALRAACARLN